MSHNLQEMNEEQRSLFDALTPLQKNVCLASLKGMNGIDSYYAGGGKAKTLATAEACASEILSNPKVKAFLSAMRESIVSDTIMTRKEMLERLSSIARTNMSDLIEWRTTLSEDADGQEVEQSCWAIKESSMLNENQMASIAEVTAGRDGFKIKQHSPLSAMRQIADMEGYIYKTTLDPVEFKFDKNKSYADQCADIVAAAAQGKISADVANVFISAIKSCVDIEESTVLKERIAALESLVN